MLNLIKRTSNSIPMKKFLTRLVIILVLIMGSLIYWKYFFDYSEGYRAGLLQKFSSKGSIFKTYEGELILSSVQSTNNMAIASEKFLFSVTEEEVARKIEKLQGENVIVHYTEKNGTLPWRGDCKYVVDSVAVKHVMK
jgi:hypothetical protein